MSSDCSPRHDEVGAVVHPVPSQSLIATSATVNPACRRCARVPAFDDEFDPLSSDRDRWGVVSASGPMSVPFPPGTKRPEAHPDPAASTHRAAATKAPPGAPPTQPGRNRATLKVDASPIDVTTLTDRK